MVFFYLNKKYKFKLSPLSNGTKKHKSELDKKNNNFVVPFIS